MELRDADIVVVGLLIAVGLAVAGYALGTAAADAVGDGAVDRALWSNFSPMRWASWGDGSVTPPGPNQPAGSIESG